MVGIALIVVCSCAFVQAVNSQYLGRAGAGPWSGPLASPLGPGPLARPLAGPLRVSPLAGPLASPLGASPLAGPLAGPLGIGPLAGPLTAPLGVGSLATPLGRGGIVAPLASPALATPGCGGVASSGGVFPVTSVSPIAPTGVSVVSENAIEGAVAVGGNLPLLGSVGVEGAFPTAGAGAVSYGCGDNGVGIASESPFVTGIVSPGPVGPAPTLAGLARAPGRLGTRAGILPGIGCGCGAFY